MSVAMPSHRIGSESFALLARLFSGLKRRGRVIDVIWFQQSPDYARAVLALADECDDDAVREMGAALRGMLGAWVAPPMTAVIALADSGPANPASAKMHAGGATPEPEALDAAPAKAPDDIDNRYVGRLR